MQIREIKVTAGRTFNHPYESYSNLRPEVQLTATIDVMEDATAATRELQGQAERLVEDHKMALLSSLHEIHELERSERQIASLEDQLRDVTSQLDRARKYIADRRAKPEGVDDPHAEASADPDADTA